MDIAVIGTGYVGLVTGAVFADLGNDVVCVDNDERKVRGLVEGKMPIFEPGLEEMVLRNASDGRLSFTTDLETAVHDAEILFIAVPTPAGGDGPRSLPPSQPVIVIVAVARIAITDSTVNARRLRR